MAATDQHYRSQRALDIVFGATSVLMLVSIIGMFVQDYNRQWKTEQRAFRDVEAAMFLRQTAADMPDPKRYAEARDQVEELRPHGLANKILALEPKEEVARAAEQILRKKPDDPGVKELASQILQMNEASAAAKRLAEKLVKVYDDAEKARKIGAEARALFPAKERLEVRVGEIKADLASRLSFYNIAVEHGGVNSPEAKQYRQDLAALEKELAAKQAELDKTLAELKAKQQQRDELERPLAQAETRLKQITDDMVRRARTALRKQWGPGDWFRSLPVIDAFASPTKIHQFTLHDLTIDYNFKGVTRFDRCMTCHLAIDRPGYSREKLASLLTIPDDLRDKAALLHEYLEELRQLAPPGEVDNIPDPARLQLTRLSKDVLTEARIAEFCSHPRLHLFVGSNSKHPAEKFGCTSCHSGQPSGTDFYWASHAPNDYGQKQRWKKEHGWEAVHYWDFPMLPKRFVEASCLKCHHQVTDLITDGVREEAPKVLHGYRLIRDLGCFGCHEIHGKKAGADVGPDLRLEPYPPLDSLTPAERHKLLSDPDNPPGKLRKVGPSLFRLSEKTNEDWTARWIRAPRSFRPDTKMPHFYGLSNNDESVLPEDQKKFPNAEIYAVTQYLFGESRGYLTDVQKAHAELTTARQTIEKDLPTLTKKIEALEAQIKAAKDKDAKARLEQDLAAERALREGLLRKALPPEQRAEDLAAEIAAANRQLKALVANPNDAKKVAAVAKERTFLEGEVKRLTEELNSVKRGIELRKAVPPLSDGKPVARPRGTDAEIQYRGRKLFTESGCLACHNHHATTESKGQEGKDFLPALASDAEFGPTLSQLREKLVADAKDEKDLDRARTWLVHWIMNPYAHSPRTKMPVTHLKPEQAADVAEWLLAQKATDLGDDWAKVQVTKPGVDVLENLVRTYVVTKILSRSDTEEMLKNGFSPERAKDMPADERELALRLNRAKDAAQREKDLTWYVGRKAVGRLGCYACHDIPGFENAKPIGTPLNEWGKKEVDRLAFENIDNFVKGHYQIIDGWTDRDGNLIQSGGKKPLYEKFFADMLKHHGQTREGYLHQKLLDPRSYDYTRELAWDVRSRMPQFQFSRPKKRGQETEAQQEAREDFDKGLGKTPVKGPLPAETDAQFNVRRQKEEADAREAVMTFVLGLVAEPIPHSYRNNPSPDRMAEVRGRQVLETFNCAGCHTIRPGALDIKLSGEGFKWLKAHYEVKSGLKQQEPGTRPEPYKNDFNFLDHIAWAGKTPSNGELTAHGLRPALRLIDDPLYDPASGKKRQKVAAVEMRLAEALRVKAPDGSFFDLRAGDSPPLLPTDLVGVPQSALRSPAAFHHWAAHHSEFGGTFSELLTGYLGQLDPKKYGSGDPNQPDDSKARAASPPALLYQGERTQPDWLYQFLMNPYRVRQMTVLQMPKFNLSEDDARALVSYFTASDRLTNPGVGLTAPFNKVPQRGDLTDDYWRQKNREFVARLKATEDPDNKKRTVWDRQVEEMQPVWSRMHKELEQQAKEAATQLADADAKLKAAEGKKDAAATAAATQARAFWEQEAKRLKDAADRAAPKAMESSWAERDAYPSSAFRLMSKLCATCHMLGNQPVTNEVQGPPLPLAPDRLRPEWTKRWLAYPNRLQSYPSLMPQNFENNASPLKLQEVFPGTPLEQLTAVRDVLMNYPRVHELPINRYWPLLEGATSAEKK